MELKPQTLAIAIQCVSTIIKILDERLGDDQSEAAADLEQRLVSFDLAEMDLKAAYELATVKYDGLPPYEDLLKWSPAT
jgi:hypothetical protein